MAINHYPRSEILSRTLPIMFNNYLGTCFTVDVAEKQYIITAKHVVEGIDGVDEVFVGRHDKWISVTVTAIPCDPDTADIIVLAPSRTVTGTLRVICQPQVTYGQDVFFIGFPFGFQPRGNTTNLAMPFCKRATVSYFAKHGDAGIIILSGQSNAGFSGAPIFFSDDSTRIIGVLTGDTRQLVKELNLGGEREAIYESAGFIEGISIKHALDAIERSSSGAPIGD